MSNALATTTESESSAEPQAYIPVALDTLLPRAVHEFDLYTRNHQNAKQYVLYRRREIPVTEDDFTRLISHGVTTLHILYDDRVVYEEYLKSLLLDPGSLSSGQKYTILKGAARTLMAETACGASVDVHVHAIDGLSRQMVHAMCNDDLVLRDIFFLMTHDYYSYTHVVNVATYCLALARTLGMHDVQELSTIVSGALLHDLGKKHLPPGLLNKPGRLTDAEMATMRMHPEYGFKELCHRRDLNWGQLMMVYQHHERLDGKGYPVQITGQEMHPWARLCAVADVFDAITSSRPYRKQMSLGGALEFMDQRAGIAFDAEIVRCLTSATRSN